MCRVDLHWVHYCSSEADLQTKLDFLLVIRLRLKANLEALLGTIVRLESALASRKRPPERSLQGEVQEVQVEVEVSACRGVRFVI